MGGPDLGDPLVPADVPLVRPAVPAAPEGVPQGPTSGAAALPCPDHGPPVRVAAAVQPLRQRPHGPRDLPVLLAGRVRAPRGRAPAAETGPGDPGVGSPARVRRL